MGDTPLIRTLEPLQPLLACGFFYLLFLTILWLVVRPRVIAIRQKRALPRLLGRLSRRLFRFGFFALLLLGGLWTLTTLGAGDNIAAALRALAGASRSVPRALWLLIIGLLSLLLVLSLLAPRLARPSFRKK